MLKIEIIKFEAQDVVTTSVAQADIKCGCNSICYENNKFSQQWHDYYKARNECPCDLNVHDPIYGD